MRATKLIALAGVSGAGKDAVASYLAAQHGFRRVAIADPLKDAMMKLFGLTREQLWGALRNTPDARLGRAPRELYQAFGKACREIDPEVWIRVFRDHTAELLRAGSSVVCTDLRTLAELRAVRDLGGAAWLLRRPTAGAPGAMALDATERELVELEGCFDTVLWNQGTLSMLHASVDLALEARSTDEGDRCRNWRRCSIPRRTSGDRRCRCCAGGSRAARPTTRRPAPPGW